MKGSNMQQLIKKIENRQAKIGVIGLGYVGLPLALAFVNEEFDVTGFDVDDSKITLLNQYESYIDDIDDAQLMEAFGTDRFTVSSDEEVLDTMNVLIICVPTPLRKTRDPDMTYIMQSIELVSKIIKPNMLVVLESTTYPGTTNELIYPKLTENGLVAGESIFIAFSPERTDPGNKKYKLRNTPKVVGGVTNACTQIAEALYKTCVDDVVKVSSPMAAEMTKILENTFRAVNIGLVNEMALMCEKLDINVWEVIKAASTKPFGFMPFYPGPGLGGHCIPVDPHYLSWKLKTLNYRARFIELASEINTSMPLYVVKKISQGLNDQIKPIKNSRILVLGVAYKQDVRDIRESPALDILELLKKDGADISYYDPYIPNIFLHTGEMIESCKYSATLLQEADCVVIVTNHSSFDWNHVVQNSKLIVDTRFVYGVHDLLKYDHIISL